MFQNLLDPPTGRFTAVKRKKVHMKTMLEMVRQIGFYVYKTSAWQLFYSELNTLNVKRSGFLKRH